MRMSLNTAERVSGFIVIKAGLVHRWMVRFHRVNHISTAAKLTFFFKASLFRKFLLLKERKKIAADEMRLCEGAELELLVCAHTHTHIHLCDSVKTTAAELLSFSS